VFIANSRFVQLAFLLAARSNAVLTLVTRSNKNKSFSVVTSAIEERQVHFEERCWFYLYVYSKWIGKYKCCIKLCIY